MLTNLCGMCSKAIDGKAIKIQGEEGLVYHRSCFRCEWSGCGRTLSVKKAFFVHDSHIFCKSHEEAFQTCKTCKQTLDDGEGEPIVNVHIDGPFYHLRCLKCKICRETVHSSSRLEELEGQFYCAQDFAMVRPVCFECGKVLEGPSIVLKDGQTFHQDCFKCYDCREELSSFQRVYGRLVCSAHACACPQDEPEICYQCSQMIKDASIIKFKGVSFHEKCFQCSKCQRTLRFRGSKKTAILDEDVLVCRACFKVQRRVPLQSGGFFRKSRMSLREISEDSLPLYDELSPSFDNDEKEDGEEIRFDRGKQIGTGGYGKVYKCRRIPDNLIVAMKEVSMSLMQKSVLYCKEVEILKQLDHENIVKLLGTQIDKGRQCLQIFMEFVPGHSLYDYLLEFGPFSEESMKDEIRQLLRGLSYLHSRNVIHRDLKSKNILISDKGVLKLCDFGSAKRIEKDSKVSVQYDGTPLWTPPETIVDGVYTDKSDIWSFGCVLIEMASATLPWSECRFDNPYVAIYHISKGSSVPKIPSHLSPLCRSLLKQCLQRDPQQRPSADSLLRHPFLRH